MPSEPVTVRLPADLAAKVDEIAARKGMTHEDVMRHLLQARLNEEDAEHRMTREGLEDIDAGRVVSHESVQVLAAGLADNEPESQTAADATAKTARLKRRAKRQRLPRGWAQGMEIPPREPAEPPKRRRKAAAPMVITDDWPEQVPISDDELRIIEGWMRKELDELFGPLP